MRGEQLAFEDFYPHLVLFCEKFRLDLKNLAKQDMEILGKNSKSFLQQLSTIFWLVK